MLVTKQKAQTSFCITRYDTGPPSDYAQEAKKKLQATNRALAGVVFPRASGRMRRSSSVGESALRPAIATLQGWSWVYGFGLVYRWRHGWVDGEGVVVALGIWPRISASQS
jgi:hypothetical protein